MTREELRDAINKALNIPMAILAIIALVIIIIDLTTDVSPEWRYRINIIYWLIWSAFLLEFVAKLLLSERKRDYVKANWVEAAIVFVPFLRILSIFRLARVTQSIAVLRLALYGRVGLSELAGVLSRRIMYLTIISFVVIILGAIGTYLFEAGAPGTMIKSYGDALWFSAAVVTTVASNLNPVTAGGRVLAFILMVYSVVVFSYLAAAIAAFFIDKDRD